MRHVRTVESRCNWAMVWQRVILTAFVGLVAVADDVLDCVFFAMSQSRACMFGAPGVVSEISKYFLLSHLDI